MANTSFTMISGGALNLASSANSDPIYIGDSGGYAIQAVWTGTPVGVFNLQISCDAAHPSDTVAHGTNPNVINWTDFTGSSQSITTAGNYLWDVPATKVRWVRLVYTSTSGSGSLTSAQCAVNVG